MWFHEGWFVRCLLFLAVLAGPAGCGHRSGPPNVILVSIDTLRADHLSCYGYHRKTSPRIDRIAAHAAVFRRAASTSSWTVPAMASIFTSKYPRSHGVRTGHVDPRSANILHQELLDKKFPVIPETFRQNGYVTFGVSTNAHMSRKTGFDHGFDHFESYWFNRADTVNATVARWRRQIESAHPYFLWVHYFDPHDPYKANAPWIDDYCRGDIPCAGWKNKAMRKLKRLKDQITGNPRAVKALIALYDSEINYVDTHLGRLLDSLPGVDDSILVIVADHGDEFMDHGDLGHGDTLYEELTHVPLIIRLPGQQSQGRFIERRVSINDIFPTLCAAAGVPEPPGLQGMNLLPAIHGDKSSPRVILSELHRPAMEIFMKSILAGPWKAVFTGRRFRTIHLYNLSWDPGETTDLAESHPNETARFREYLDAFMTNNPRFQAPLQEQTLSDRERRELKAMGYIY